MLPSFRHSIRRPALVLSAVLALALAGCGRDATPAATGPAAAPGAGQTLNVYNWSDYIGKDTLHDFEAQTGTRVLYSVYATNDALLEKLAASPNTYDVVFPTARPYAQRMVASGQLAALDKTRLPNLAHLDPAIMAELATIDPGNAHIVPYMWGTTGLGIDVERVRQALGPGAALDSWGLLFDPANAAKLSACGIGVVDNAEEGFPAALFWKGLAPTDFGEASGGAVRDAYAAIRTHVRKFGNDDEMIEGLADGTFCLVLTFSGDVQQARARAVELAGKNGGKPRDIRYVIPREGAIRWIDTIAIPKDAPNPEAAHRFVNYLLTPKVIASISDEVSYANGNRDATPLVDKAITGDPGIYPPAAVRAKLATAGNPSGPEAAARKRIWDSIVYGSF
ncbi:MAG: extracellular solute-binding protein [Xanthomonadales bacterium]|nr:extracellular solute-binding protein [Xanthomonadales bacterium]